MMCFKETVCSLNAVYCDPPSPLITQWRVKFNLYRPTEDTEDNKLSILPASQADVDIVRSSIINSKVILESQEKMSDSER